MSLIGSSHTVHRFDEELNKIASLVDRMGALAIDQLQRAVQTLKDEDPVAAQHVISRDRELNALDVEIDEKIIQMIAKRQPMARDLRQIVTLGKVVNELERAGDEARKLAKLAVHFYEGEGAIPSEHILRDIYSMADYVGEMLTKSMRGFSSLDIQLALSVLKMDEQLENEFSSTLRRLSTFIMEDSRNVGHFVEIVLCIRALERFGGRAKNIAGHIIFLAKGHDVRHATVDEILRLFDQPA
jgi:phosphate transport system protein